MEYRIRELDDVGEGSRQFHDRETVEAMFNQMARDGWVFVSEIQYGSAFGYLFAKDEVD